MELQFESIIIIRRNNAFKMRIVYIKTVILAILAFHGIAYAQFQKWNDTLSKVIICESTLSYPLAAQENNISGTVLVAYDIDSNCRIFNIRIEKSIGYGCDEEAIKALAKCRPRFIGAQKKCLPIFNLRQPFTFKKSEED